MRVAVAEEHLIAFPPDEHPQRQLDPDPRIGLHQGGPAAGISEQDDILVRELHADLPRRGRVVDPIEHRETPPFDRVHQSPGRLGVAGSASLACHLLALLPGPCGRSLQVSLTFARQHPGPCAYWSTTTQPYTKPSRWCSISMGSRLRQRPTATTRCGGCRSV